MPPKKTEQARSAGVKRKRSGSDASSSERSDEQLKALLTFLRDDSVERFGNGSDAKQPNLFDLIEHSATYTPFQSLVASIVQSKPISSRLGARTLLTIFAGTEGVKGGIDFSTPGKIVSAGEDGRYDALSKARTQHKDKTSLQLARLSEKVIEEYAESEDDVSLSKLRDKLGGSADNLASIIKDFYGAGETAVEIFRRRLQVDWEELYPFADERTINAAAHLGLAHDSAEALAEQIKQLLPAKDATAERKQFTKIVDALVASDLEHKYDELEDIMQGKASVNDHPADEETEEEEDQEKPAAKAAKKEE